MICSRRLKVWNCAITLGPQGIHPALLGSKELVGPKGKGTPSGGRPILNKLLGTGNISFSLLKLCRDAHENSQGLLKRLMVKILNC